MGYPNNLLESRGIIKHGRYALVPPEGLVNNVVPTFEKCRISIVASPKLGASFVHYIAEFAPEGGNTKGFGGNGIETFVYVVEGNLDVAIDNNTYNLTQGGYAYCPPNKEIFMKNNYDKDAKLVLYKQRYIPFEDKEPWVVVDNVNNLEVKLYENLEEVTLLDLLPTDIAFDMNMHILTFQPGSGHAIVETHVQEHGAYLLSGEGMYNLENEWVPVKKGDYIWMGAYVQQGAYAVGREPLSYVYSKDCNRDVEI